MTDITKVLHVIPSVAAIHGGPSVMIEMMARGLLASGVDVHIATTNDDGAGLLNVPCGVPVVRDGLTSWYFPRQLSFYKVSLPLQTWLSESVANYRLVHIHALFSHSSWAAARAARAAGIPYLVRPLGVLNRWGMENRRPWLKKMSFRYLEKPMIEGAALMHYTSEQEREEASRLGVTAKSEIIPNPVPTTGATGVADRFLDKYPALRGKKVVLFLSRIDRKKGLDLLFPAFELVRAHHPDAVLVIAGAGDETLTAALRARSPDVLWTGFLAGEDKADAFAAADIYILPSWSENFGVSVVEAMAAGCPVVVSDQVAIHTDIANAEAGLVAPCKVPAIAGALTQLLSDERSRKAMGSNAIGLTQTHYSPAAVTAKLLDVYRSILN